jgi:hypothetical protein
VGLVRYIIFVIDGRSNTADGNEMEAIDSFNERLRSDGNWVMAAGIAGPDRAKLIDGRNGATASASRSLFDTAEHYSGFWVIEAPSDDIAERLAHDGSNACNRRVELRPFLR